MSAPTGPQTPVAPSSPVLSERELSRRAAWRWGTLIVTLLGLQVVVGVVAVVLATGDPSVAVVPDYYQKALHWDQEMETRRASQQLGWAYELLVPQVSDTEGLRAVTLRLYDDRGGPVLGATGEIRAYHRARATDVRTVPLESLGGGNYRARVPMRRPGFWELRVDVYSDEKSHFIVDQTVAVETNATLGQPIERGAAPDAGSSANSSAVVEPRSQGDA